MLNLFLFTASVAGFAHNNIYQHWYDVQAYPQNSAIRCPDGEKFAESTRLSSDFYEVV